MWEFDQSLGDRRKNLANPPSFEEITEHRRFKRGTANMAAPFRGFLTSHNGASVNFLGDGTIFSGGTARPLRSVRTGAWDVRAPGMWQLDDCRTRREEILQSGMPKGRMGVRKQQALLQRH